MQCPTYLTMTSEASEAHSEIGNHYENPELTLVDLTPVIAKSSEWCVSPWILTAVCARKLPSVKDAGIRQRLKVAITVLTVLEISASWH